MTMTVDQALSWIAKLFEEPEGKVTPETSRDDLPAWDSLGTLSLIAGLEEQFDILVSEDELRQIRKVGDILELLTKAGKLS